MKLPKLDWSLLVPSANCGGSPASSSAGTVISPPPPAMESTSPAARAAKSSSGYATYGSAVMGHHHTLAVWEVPTERGDRLMWIFDLRFSIFD